MEVGLLILDFIGNLVDFACGFVSYSVITGMFLDWLSTLKVVILSCVFQCIEKQISGTDLEDYSFDNAA